MVEQDLGGNAVVCGNGRSGSLLGGGEPSRQQPLRGETLQVLTDRFSQLPPMLQQKLGNLGVARSMQEKVSLHQQPVPVEHEHFSYALDLGGQWLVLTGGGKGTGELTDNGCCTPVVDLEEEVGKAIEL